jgi:hypothetical protein
MTTDTARSVRTDRPLGDAAIQFAAVTAALCALTHIALLAVGGSHLFMLTIPMLVLSLTCAGCGTRSWFRRTSLRERATMLGTGLTMGVGHLLIERRGSGAMPGMADPPMSAHAPGTSAGLLMQAGITLALTQSVLVGVAILLATTSADPETATERNARCTTPSC